MLVKTVFDNGELTALLSGDIDHHTARGMRLVIDGDIERYRPVSLALDFRRVRFMDSSGIGLIMGRCRLMQLCGGSVRLENIPPSLERLIALSGVRCLTDEGR